MMENTHPQETVADRLDRELGDTPLRILIVGAGIAGSTLAALLHQRGQNVAVVERTPIDDTDGGYMLGLMPLGGRVLNGLGLAGAYRDGGIAMDTYDLYNRHGNLIRSFPLDSIVNKYGSWRGIERGYLVDLLRQASGPIEYDTTIDSLNPNADDVDATFDDGSTTSFHLVVAADGIHSSTRSLILEPGEVSEFDTGWGGFVAWSTFDDQSMKTYSELWSAGWGIGLYPAKDRLGVFLGGRHDAVATLRAHDYADELAIRVPSGPFAKAIANLESTQGFYWAMADTRANVWSRGRVILLGDAATSFLPTAGIGASAAMDSAAALADELSRADTVHLKHALDLYERRQRHRVETAQDNSRRLARFMFVNKPTTAWIRDQAMRFYSLGTLTRGISKVMAGG